MSSPHRSQIEWFSFLFLPFILILELPSPTSGGKCEERCDLDRLPGSTEAYTLNCDHVYENPGDIKICQNDCTDCSNICNSTNPSVFHCPRVERDHRLCQHRCDADRISSGAYDLNCSKIYNSSSDIEHCRSYCIFCPREICVISTPDIYKCPSHSGSSRPISNFCLRRCNMNRPKGSTGAYTLSCIKEYQTHEELNLCRDDSYYCPRNVSTPYNPDIFHCPPGPTGRCKERCDNNREPGTTAKYTLDCEKEYDTEQEVSYCAADCNKCPAYVCQVNEKTIFKCPEIPHPLPPPPPPSYEGKCEKRCNDNRKRGSYGISNKPYKLKCDQAYQYDSDLVTRCKRDCRFCPNQVCGKDPNTYRCPVFKSRKRCDNICNANRKNGSTKSYTLNCSKEYSLDVEIQYCRRNCVNCKEDVCNSKYDNDTYHCPAIYNSSANRPDHSSRSSRSGRRSTVLIICLVVSFLILVGCMGTYIYYSVRKKPNARSSKYYGTSGENTGQQKQPLNLNYEDSQASASSLSIALPASPSKSAVHEKK